MSRRNYFQILIITIVLIFLSSSTLGESNSNRKICFTSNRFGSWDLFLVNEDGSQLKRLTNSDEDELNPIWSPDGRKILFFVDKSKFLNPIYDLWLINADGSNLKKVEEEVEVTYGQKPKWSPDSRKILYVTKKREIKIFNLETNSSKNLLKEGVQGEQAVWSPDGSTILAYLKTADNPGIYRISPEGSERELLVDDKGDFEWLRWSPDGSMFSYIYDKPFFSFGGKKSGLYVLDREAENGKYLGEAFYYKWCPDNISIVYMEKDDNIYDDSTTKLYHTYIVNADVNNPKISRAKLNSTTNYKIYPSWSPDGMKIAYKEMGTLYIRESGSSELIKIDVPQSSNYDNAPAWSGDSEKLVVIGFDGLFTGGGSDLYILNYRDNKVYNLTNTEKASETAPAWAPDQGE